MKKIIVSLSMVFFTLAVFGQNILINADLQGRNAVTIGQFQIPDYPFKEEGNIVVTIWVDREGEVQRAVPGAAGTTISDSQFWTKSRIAAMSFLFNKDLTAEDLQEGTITFSFMKDTRATETKAEDNSTRLPDNIKLLDRPEQYLMIGTYVVFQVLDETSALIMKNSNPNTLICLICDKKSDLYDGKKITVAHNGKAIRYGTYSYVTKDGFNKTVPLIRIVYK
jgi:hypothetical protein